MTPESLGLGVVLATGRYRRAPFPRNPWDLQVFAGKLFIGSGDSADNAGPVDVAFLDLATGAWGHEGELPEEQIDAFQVLGDDLVIPGHDPRGGGGSFYYRLAWGWGVEWRPVTVGGAEHVFSVAELGESLFASLGRMANGAPFAISRDGGGTWERHREVKAGRHYSSFAFGGSVYSFGVLPFNGVKHDRLTARLPSPYNLPDWWALSAAWPDLEVSRRPDLDVKTLFPAYRKGVPGFIDNVVHKVTRAVPFGDSVLYLGGTVHGDFGTRGHSASLARSLTAGNLSVHGIDLGGRTPWDLLVRDDRAYMLTSRKAVSGFLVEVLGTSDGIEWSPVFGFPCGTFARSFEEAAGAFYFGLGTDYGTDSPLSGEILRVTL